MQKNPMEKTLLQYDVLAVDAAKEFSATRTGTEIVPW